MAELSEAARKYIFNIDETSLLGFSQEGQGCSRRMARAYRVGGWVA